MAKFRGITWNNSRFGPKIQIRRSIDLAELGDLGNITDDANDLPTRGAVHRADKGGSTSGTRNYTDFRGIAGQYSNVVDTQDMGLISDTAAAHRVWSSTGAISDIVTSAPTTLYNPGSTGSTSSTVDNITLDDGTGPEFINSSLLGDTQYFDFNGDGTELYVHNKPYNVNAYKLTKYNLSTAYDLGTASNPTNKTYNMGNDYDGRFGDSGMKFYVNNGTIYQFDLQNAYELSNHIGSTSQADASTAGAEAFAFKPDGTKLYTLARNNSSNGIIQRSLSTAWDVDTAAYDGGSFTSGVDSGNYYNEMVGASSFDINSNGTKLYILTRSGIVSDNSGPDNRDIAIVEYDLTTAWDISTMTYNDKYYDLSSDGFISNEQFTLRLEDDQYLFVRGRNSNVTNNGHTIYRYDLT